MFVLLIYSRTKNVKKYNAKKINSQCTKKKKNLKKDRYNQRLGLLCSSNLGLIIQITTNFGL